MNIACHNLTLAGRLSGVSATFQPGQLTAICGPNGAGKSTLLAALAGLLPATGTVTLGDQPLHQIPAHHRAQTIGYLPQSGDIAWDVSVETLVGLGRLPWRGAPGGRAIDAALATMDLEPLRHRPLSRLSGGERARALVARVLAGTPRWLLADEPLASLDLAHAAALMAALRAEAARGTGVIVVLHDLAMAMNHADAVLVLADGALAAQGPPESALCEAVIARVWQVAAHWHGAPHARALALDARPA